MNRNVFKPFVSISILLLVIGQACSISLTSPTATPTATLTPTTTLTPTAAFLPATQEPTLLISPTDLPPTDIPLPTATEISPFFTEEWDNGFGVWEQQIGLNGSNGDTSQAHITVENGKLVFALGRNLIAYVFFPTFIYESVRIDAHVNNRGTNVNDVLLVCRKSDAGHYLVNIANSGLYAMYAFDGVHGSYTRIADGGSNNIRQGHDVNDYALICNGRTLILYINGFETRTFTDNDFALPAGQIGVGVASEEQTPVKVEFEWVQVSQP